MELKVYNHCVYGNKKVKFMENTTSSFACPLCDVASHNWFADSFLLAIHSLVHIVYGVVDAFAIK